MSPCQLVGFTFKLYKLKRYPQALIGFNKLVVIFPEVADVWFYQGTTLYSLNRNEDAIASYDKALEIQPDFAGAYYNKACCYALQENIELAIQNLQRAITLDEQFRDMAKTDKDFDKIRHDARFDENFDF